MIIVEEEMLLMWKKYEVWKLWVKNFRVEFFNCWFLLYCGVVDGVYMCWNIDFL